MLLIRNLKNSIKNKLDHFFSKGHTKRITDFRATTVRSHHHLASYLCNVKENQLRRRNVCNRSEFKCTKVQLISCVQKQGTNPAMLVGI